MFNETKYTKWYFSIIESRRSIPASGNVEKHHILPESMGGGNDNCNLVSLTPREHFICHLLLTKMTSGSAKAKMVNAAFSMVNWNKQKINSRMYQTLRNQHSLFMQENNPMFDPAVRQKVSETNKGKPSKNKGRVHSIETKQKLSLVKKGSIPWNKGTKGVCKGNPGLKHSEESIAKIRQARANQIVRHSEETKRKMSESAKLRWAKINVPE